jgi:hypothetical protein
MSEPLNSWAKAEAFALALPGTERGLSYRMPTVKVSANGRSFLWTSHEAQTSFAIPIDMGTAEMLMETDPETFWQSPHYAGGGAVLIRYSSPDPERVRFVIEQAHRQASALKPARPRKK